jgi:hypothetical protein
MAESTPLSLLACGDKNPSPQAPPTATNASLRPAGLAEHQTSTSDLLTSHIIHSNNINHFLIQKQLTIKTAPGEVPHLKSWKDVSILSTSSSALLGHLGQSKWSDRRPVAQITFLEWTFDSAQESTRYCLTTSRQDAGHFTLRRRRFM